VQARSLLRLAYPQIARALIKANGNIRKAAEILDVKRTTLHMWCKQLVEQGLVDEHPTITAREMAECIERQAKIDLIQKAWLRCLEENKNA